MDRTYHQHTDYSNQQIKHNNTDLTISKSLLHPKITQQVTNSYKFWELFTEQSIYALKFSQWKNSIMSSLPDSCVRWIIKSKVSKTHFISIITTLMVVEWDSNIGFYNSSELAVCPRRLYWEQSMVKVFSEIRILYLKTMHLPQICQNNI